MFIAHPVPANVRATLDRQLRPYRRAHAHVRWTRPDTWHLTLLFLGSVPAERVPELERVVDHVAAATATYRVRVGHGDGRLQRDGGVAWLGLVVGAGRLVEAATLAARTCPPDVSAGAPRRTPSAHLTVVRGADRAVIDALREQAHGPLGVDWIVEHLDLVRSHLGPRGARYETLYRAAL